MKKRIMALLMGVLLLSGCGGEKAGEKIDAAAVQASLLADCTYITEEMYEQATAFPEGDLTRIAAAMRKAEDGGEVTIGVIGGSITQGSSASSQDKNYASLLKKWWENSFPQAKITLVNAGVGGTSSYLGIHRAEEDLLCQDPDFVVVEFSVNDANTPFYKKSYDNLVYRILTQDNAPGVLLLFMTMEDGTSAQENDSMIGFRYGLPMISYRNAVMYGMEQGLFAWKDISPDNIHPNDRGHAMVGELLEVCLGGIRARLQEIPGEKAAFTKPIVTKEVYMDAAILNREDLEPVSWGSFAAEDVSSRFPGNWTTASGEEGIVFETEAANIGIMYQKYTNGTGGQYEVYVDGEYRATLDADFSGGWGNYGETVEVFSSDEKKVRRIEIKRKEGTAEGAFSIMGLLVS